MHLIRITNSSKQTIPLQARPPKGDFFLHEQQVYIAPGKSVELPKDYVIADQIDNLKARGMLRVTFDGEA